MSLLPRSKETGYPPQEQQLHLKIPASLCFPEVNFPEPI
jgi:hypothetical protein